MKSKKVFFILVVGFFLIPFISADFSNSSHYNMSVVISGGANNGSSANYAQTVVVGGISGNTSGGNYSNTLGVLSIGDVVPPAVTIYSPTSTAYSSSLISIDIRLNEQGYCKYSLDSGASNYSMTANNSNTGFTTTTSSLSNGIYTLYAYCNDTADNINHTQSVSFTVSVTPTPVASSTSSSSSGGGGGGFAVAEDYLSIDVTDLEVPIVVNTVKTRIILLTNSGDSFMNIKIQLRGLDKIMYLEEISFILAPGEKKGIELKFVGPEKPGIYTGKVLINGQEIYVSVNVNTKELLFDAGIMIPEEYKSINEGDKLVSQVTLIPMGENPRVDVTLSYIIKDFEGRTFFTESETILIDSQKTFKKEFATQNLPAGNYVLGLELVYSNGVATSTSHFKIMKKEKFIVSNYLYVVLLFLGGGIIIIVIMTLWIIRKYKNIRRLKKR